MINLQNPNIPIPLMPIEIDALIYDLQLKLDTNISWLTHSYARAYRHFQMDNGKMMFFPEVYKGVEGGKPTYFQPRPDNDKKGQSYFVVGKEKQKDFVEHDFNYLEHDFDIVFLVNLKLINEGSLDTELITQHLIKDVRNILTRKLLGTFYTLEIKEVLREFNQVFREYSHKEKENYLKAPLQGFRFNCKVMFQEDCITLPIDRCSIIKQNISSSEALCLLPNLDFSIDEVFNTLTEAQKQELSNRLI